MSPTSLTATSGSGSHPGSYQSVPLLQSRFSDYASWIERLQAKLEAKGLWDSFCMKPDVPPDEASDKVAHDRHMVKRYDCRWKIIETMSPDLSRTVRDEETPFAVVEQLKKMLVGYSLLTCVQQYKSLMTMKYVPGSDLLKFVQAMKDGFHTLETSGVAISSVIRPYVLINAIDSAFDHVLQLYLIVISQKGEELKFDQLVELLESTYIQEQRKSQFEHHEDKIEEESALVGHDRKIQGFNRKRNRSDERCHHCNQFGHYLRDCRIYKVKVDHGWRHPLRCRTSRDFHDDDRDPTRHKRRKPDELKKLEAHSKETYRKTCCQE